MSIPKFDFSESPIKTEEELQASPESLNQGQNKYFRPGRHDATIVKVEYQGQAKDPTWGKFLVHLEGTGRKEIRSQVMVPFKSVEFIDKSGRPTKFLYQKFVAFMASLGYTVKVQDLQTLLPEVWTKPENTLVGKTVGIDVGYRGNFIRYDGKDEIGQKKYTIEFADGSVLCDASKRVMYFADYDAVMAHAEANQTEIQRFVDVLSFVTPKNATSNSGW